MSAPAAASGRKCGAAVPSTSERLPSAAGQQAQVRTLGATVRRHRQVTGLAHDRADDGAAMPRHTRTTSHAMPKKPPRTPAPMPCSIAASGFCSFDVGCHFGCAGSSGNAIGGRPFNELSIGISVIATTSEMPIASATVSAWSRNSCPAIPCTKTSGRNTAIVVSVEATTAMLTSRVPAMAASRMPRPRSRALAIDSSTTIESSTTRPVASARPPSDITLRLRPKRPMKKNVAMIDTGSDSPTTNVLQPSRRNRKMIRIASRPPMTRVQLHVADRVADELRLVVDGREFDVRRDLVLELLQPLLDRVARWRRCWRRLPCRSPVRRLPCRRGG